MQADSTPTKHLMMHATILIHNSCMKMSLLEGSKSSLQKELQKVTRVRLKFGFQVARQRSVTGNIGQYKWKRHFSNGTQSVHSCLRLVAQGILMPLVQELASTLLKAKVLLTAPYSCNNCFEFLQKRHNVRRIYPQGARPSGKGNYSAERRWPLANPSIMNLKQMTGWNVQQRNTFWSIIIHSLQVGHVLSFISLHQKIEGICHMLWAFQVLLVHCCSVLSPANSRKMSPTCISFKALDVHGRRVFQPANEPRKTCEFWILNFIGYTADANPNLQISKNDKHEVRCQWTKRQKWNARPMSKMTNIKCGANQNDKIKCGANEQNCLGTFCTLRNCNIGYIGEFAKLRNSAIQAHYHCVLCPTHE